MAKQASRKTESPRRRTSAGRTKPRSGGAKPAKAADTDHGAPTVETGVGPTDEEIRVRAYFRYLERGGSGGASFDDWAEAEKDLATARGKK